MIFILINIMSDDEKDLVNEIFSKTNVKMYNMSYNILRSHNDAEEAVSQTFLKIMEHIKRISDLPRLQIEPYCVKILKNEAMNILRQRKKHAIVDEIDYLEQNSASYDIEEYINSLEKEKLLACVNRLSDEERNFIYFRFAYEMGYKQISELLDITEEAAKKRGQRILKKLRLYYKGGDNDVKSN